MEVLSLTIRAFHKPVVILAVGLVRHAVDIARLFVLADMHFIRFMGSADHTERSIIGAPIPSVAGNTDGNLRAD
jgi:hypothetical protein